MDIWFLNDYQRLQLERRNINQLLETSAWLRSACWVIDDGKLAVNATIRSHQHDYKVVLVYPALFPEVPAFVLPADENERWSEHQYLNGTLCLEWGPDTWHPSVTGAQVLESAFKLLDTENPLGDGPRQTVPTRHRLSLGQELRSEYGRVFLTPSIQVRLEEAPLGSTIPIKFTWLNNDSSAVLLIHSLDQSDGTVWTDDAIPKQLTSQNTCVGLFFKTELPASEFTSVSDIASFVALLNETQAEHAAAVIPTARHSLLVVSGAEETAHAFWHFLGEEDASSLVKSSVIASEIHDFASRLPPQLHLVTTKQVGIVGVGSLGSKIAVSLCRSGVRDFLIVDPDVFLPGNIARHELDWRNVGAHKVDAIKQRLEFIAPGVSVETVKASLGGQESSSFLSSVLSQLGQCDIIVDATAEGRAFNLLAAVARRFAKPIIWMEVYAGGIGGFVARSRPGIDADPYLMRRHYHAFADKHADKELPVTLENYGAVTDEGRPLQATDADVTVIAGHVTRLVLDTLVEGISSIFPYSMYLIGLQKSWVFSAPFHTIPISDDTQLESENGDGVAAADINETLDFIRSLLEMTDDETHPSETD
ncbi:MAG TPA: ThiF family adenylyltransferase [Bellilinea sp.]|nr:ThiF family adenylyltransferase [Bellilinea sp.]